MLTFKVEPRYGSNLKSLKYNDRELIYCDQKLLTSHDFTGNFVLWPFPNRVRDRRYQFNGREYSLAKVKVPRGNFPLIHGLVRDEKWQVKQTATGLKTWIEIKPGFKYWECWPFKSRLSLEYKLGKNKLRISYKVENLGTKELGFGFALHPMFKDATAIKVPAKWVMEADEDLLPLGKLLPADLNELKPVAKLNLDHVFTGLTGPQTISFKNNLSLTISTSKDFTHCVVYTGEKEKFSCVESQTCSTDAFNLDAKGLKKEAHLIRLKRGGKHAGWIEYAVRTIKN